MTRKICPIEKKRRKNERAKILYKKENEVKHLLTDDADKKCDPTYKFWNEYFEKRREQARVNSLNYRRRKKYVKTNWDKFEWDDLTCLE